MVWAPINATNPVQLGHEFSNAIPTFPKFVLLAIFLVYALYNYTTTKRKGTGEGVLVDSVTVAGFITSIIAVLLFVVDYVDQTTVFICMATTLLFAVISFIIE